MESGFSLNSKLVRRLLSSIPRCGLKSLFRLLSFPCGFFSDMRGVRRLLKTFTDVVDSCSNRVSRVESELVETRQKPFWLDESRRNRAIRHLHISHLICPQTFAKALFSVSLGTAVIMSTMCNKVHYRRCASDVSRIETQQSRMESRFSRGSRIEC